VTTTRILIADDHPAFRTGLQQMLQGVPDLEVVGEADNGTQVVELTQELAPDVVVMDLRMPGVDGIEATRRLQQVAPSAAVIVLTMFDPDARTQLLLTIGLTVVLLLVARLTRGLSRPGVLKDSADEVFRS